MKQWSVGAGKEAPESLGFGFGDHRLINEGKLCFFFVFFIDTCYDIKDMCIC